MNMLKYLIAAALLLTSTPAIAQDTTGDWLEIGTSSTEATVLVRPNDVLNFSPTQRFRELWVRWDHSRNKTTPWRSAIFLYETDCNQRTIRNAGGVAYYPNGRNESVDPDYRAQKVPPETMLEVVYEAACLNYGG